MYDEPTHHRRNPPFYLRGPSTALQLTTLIKVSALFYLYQYMAVAFMSLFLDTQSLPLAHNLDCVQAPY